MTDLIAQLLPGLAAMANIHPLVVHFPIALLTSFFLLELLATFSHKGEYLRITSSWLLYLGTLGAFAAVAAGLWAEATVPHTKEVKAIIENHEELGFAVLSLAIVLSVWRLINGARFSRIGQFAHLLFAFIMVTTMTMGADLGGLMVYGYGVATRAAEETDSHASRHGGEGTSEQGVDESFMDEANRIHRND